jgi:uncharacterized protein (DUF2236 family)
MCRQAATEAKAGLLGAPLAYQETIPRAGKAVKVIAIGLIDGVSARGLRRITHAHRYDTPFVDHDIRCERAFDQSLRLILILLPRQFRPHFGIHSRLAARRIFRGAVTGSER